MDDTGRRYHTACTGPAAGTVQKHSDDAEIILFGACFCPFVQRVWSACEFFGLPYKVDKTLFHLDPYKKPEALLNISPKGLVPAVILNNYDPPRSLNDSTVILEYLEDLAKERSGKSLMPPLSDPYARALVRLQADQAARTVSAFYKFLQSQSTTDQIDAGKTFLQTIEATAELLERTERQTSGSPNKALGLWQEGGELGWLDVLLGPWLFRATNVLKHYRGFEIRSAKVSAWIQRIIEDKHFAATCSDEQLYVDSYERYAFNRPNTSQVADAINSGRALP
ncbi:glutathione S-transferase [Pterulicium gracile]|uniref:Glutathione S-transferase n=1 Tax=Pterulicium gracile TaxID=1884261 RepID=A0A5C3QHW4_9AGAR|nr:glutathione S-transferase [Pterula gracilis]